MLGEPNKGLSYMFQMMNEARLDVGMGACAIASAAYYASLQYAQERLQGRKPTAKDPTLPQVPIIDHADVRRMLLFQRAVIEGSLGVVLQCAKYRDLEKVSDGEEKERAKMLLDLLTPVAKSYPSEMGILSVSQGLQILGGYGYCDEFPMEQYYRDMRIHPIHEGTTCIHGMDILGRKVRMKGGKSLRVYLEEVRQSLSIAKQNSELVSYAERLEIALATVEDVTATLLGVASDKGEEVFLADATLYLELFGIVSIAWQWLLQGMAIQRAFEGHLSNSEINFYRGKWVTFQYFFHYETPKNQRVGYEVERGRRAHDPNRTGVV